MTKSALLILFSWVISMSASDASYSVPLFERHLEQAKNVVVGKISRSKNGEFYFLVEESLKGELVKNSMALLNQNSSLAWFMDAPGGPRKVSREQFSERVVEKEWFGKRVVLLGEFKDGLWISSYLDHSVWLSGKSTGDKRHRAMSLKDLITVIKVVLKKESEVK